MKHLYFWLILTGLIISFTASADRSVAKTVYNQAKVLIEAAQRNEAQKYAAFELKAARDNLNTAKVKLEEKEWVEAEIAAKKSQRDAEVAGAKAMAVKSERALKDIQTVVESLKQELNRAGGQQ